METPPWKLVAASRCACGESPLWHPEQQAFYWADLPAGRLFCYRPADESYALVREGPPLGALTLQADGHLLLMGEAGQLSLWRDGKETPGPALLPGHPRFNDALADPHGRVYSGTMPRTWATTDPQAMGGLYRLDPDGSIHQMADGFRGANGLAFSADRRQLHLVDSPTQRIWAFDYHASTGELGERRLLLDTSDLLLDHPGSFPDGMTRDRQGHLWVARWGGGTVDRYDAAGKLHQRLALPTPAITSVAFGGADLSTLFVTSARPDDTPADDLYAGGTYALEFANVRGVAEYRSQYPPAHFESHGK